MSEPFMQILPPSMPACDRETYMSFFSLSRLSFAFQESLVDAAGLFPRSLFSVAHASINLTALGVQCELIGFGKDTRNGDAGQTGGSTCVLIRCTSD